MKLSLARVHYTYKATHAEAWFWIAAITALAFTNPADVGHASLCVTKFLNLGFCPGCGLGSSIGWIFRGEFIKSINSHPLGVAAIVILLARSFKLLKHDFQFKRV